MKQAIIIGAGPAGLTAADFLLDNDYKVTVLEADDIVGGISRTIEYHGNRMDIGGHRFFSKDQEVVNYWLDLLPLQGEASWDEKQLDSRKAFNAGGPSPEKCDDVMLLRRRVSRILYLGKFFDYPISFRFATFKNLGFKRSLMAGLSYMRSMMFKRLPEKTLRDFMVNRFGEALYKMFFEKYTEKLWGVSPENIDASWGAQRIKGLSLLKCVTNLLACLLPVKRRKVETSLIDEFMYPKKGPGQLWEKLAERVISKGGTILKKATVKQILLGQSRTITRVGAVTESGLQFFDADCVFSSMPIKDLVSSFPPQCVPDDVKHYAENLPYRDFISVGLEVPALAITNETNLKTLHGLVPDCWIYIQEPQVRLGRLQVFNNWSPYMVREPDKSVWIGLEYFCTENDEMWQKTQQEFIDFAVNELKQIHVLAPDTRIINSIQVKIKKAYPAYFGTYAHFDEIRNWLDSFSNLYCIGRNGQHRYNNMDHSVRTAIEAVRAELSQTDKKRIWSVNTEQDYHEQK